MNSKWAQGRSFYKTVKTIATSKNDAYSKITSEFWENNLINAIQVIARNIDFIN